ncbi:hypothetical protein VWM68_10075, partial [Campylobacter coli]
VYHEIVRQKKAEVNAWVLSKIEPMIEDIEDGEFLKRFEAYLNAFGILSEFEKDKKSILSKIPDMIVKQQINEKAVESFLKTRQNLL